MKKTQIQLTTAQFAQLHEVNKRTLHYYDSIGLFSPSSKGDNHYRYYDIIQSIDFEYIRMFKELNMSIEEISAYLKNPNSADFIKIADTKIKEAEKQIQRLKKTKKILQTKKEQIEFCSTIEQQMIQVVESNAEKILATPYPFVEDNLAHLFSYAKEIWGIEQIRMGIGSYISVEKILSKNFDQYDGLFTPALKNRAHAAVQVRPKGKYLCGYQKGIWDRLPELYMKMTDYAQHHHLKLTGYAYEIGLNDFVITNEADYITKIMIKIE